MIRFIFILATVSAYTFNNTQILNNTRFKNWINDFKIILTDDMQQDYMYKNWLENDKFISEFNSINKSYTLGHNAFSGMNTDDFSEFMGFRTNQELITTNSKQNNDNNYIKFNDLPTFIDWRQKGVVNEIKNQMSCGSCWAFSAISTVESAIAIKTGILFNLSEQQLVSCARLKYGNMGCNGGMYSGAWTFLETEESCTEESYPYTSGTSTKTGLCNNTCEHDNYKVSNYVTVVPNSDLALINALVIEPVSIAIEADTKTFQLYKSGIYSDYEGCNANSKTKGLDSQPNIDHAVVLVGYDNDYYILRNSWGTSWGDNGYMYIARGTQYEPFGMCGVLYQPMYPVI